MVLTRSQSRLIEKSSSPDLNKPEEPLGHGCRVSRSSYSLDKQYLRESPHFFTKKHLHTTTPAADDTHSRYPQRDAAKRALSNLRYTMKALDEGSNSESAFNFSHHPHQFQDEERSSSSSSGLLSSSSTGSEPQNYCGRKRKHTGRSEGRCTMDGRGRKLEQEGKANPSRMRSSHSQREDSVESLGSISDSSLRQGSDSTEEGLSASGEDDSLSDESVVENPKELFHKASAKAKESVARNIDINHYMIDAIGTPVERNQKKREFDRRYRHLFIADKKEKKMSFRGDGVEGSGSAGDVTPLSIDPTISFDSVGGLPQHIAILREMVLFPLLYPELLSQFHLRPPRGVLFVGPPGTGKTLMARALANEGTTAYGPSITFFMRKGADILSKWVGESERQLSLLFEEAKARKPSIIFFDEIDGLAPVRHGKTEQSHAALVSTFLALMDGLEDRGQVVVIGATNRPDTIDPALRRPGRFDRDLVFPYPNKTARKHVLTIVARGMLSPSLPVSSTESIEVMEGSSQVQDDHLFDELASMTEGFSGADLKALCVEAGLNRLRASLPQLYTTSKRLTLPPMGCFSVAKEDFFVAVRRIQASVSRTSLNGYSHHLEEHWTYLLEELRENVLSTLSHMWPSVSAVLQEESIDCADVGAAVRQLCSFPVPVEKNLFMLLLEAPSVAVSVTPSHGFSNSSTEIGTFLAFSLIRRLPSYKPLVVHMNHIEIDFDCKVAEDTASSSEVFTQGHLFELVSFLRRSAPCILILQGVDEWWEMQMWGSASLEDIPENKNASHARSSFLRMCQAWVYYMKLLSQSEILIIVPCRTKSEALRSFFRLRPLVSKHQPQNLIEETFSIPWTAVEVPSKPSRSQLIIFVQYMVRIFYTSLLQEELQHNLPVELNASNLNSPLAIHGGITEHQNSEEDDKVLKLWRKVEFRRLQLRHVLSKWVSQYVSSGKYKCLLSPDLDLTSDDEILKDWRSYTSDTRIGLHDILDKVERHEYVCLSQYHDDIDMLVRNVRSFFRSRSPLDLKYRLKALDLKENTVLSLYKINRHLVHFCEEHKDVTEPLNSSQERAADVPKKQILTPLYRTRRESYPRKHRKISWGRRRKRKKNRLERATSPAVEEVRMKDEACSTGLDEFDSERLAKKNDGAPAESTKGSEEISPSSSSKPSEMEFIQVVELLQLFTFLELDRMFFKVMHLLHEEIAGTFHGGPSASRAKYADRQEIFHFFRNCITKGISY